MCINIYTIYEGSIFITFKVTYRFYYILVDLV